MSADERTSRIADIIDTRRRLHRMPEEGCCEFQTTH